MKRREFLRVMGLGLVAMAIAGNGNDRGNTNEKPTLGNPNEKPPSNERAGVKAQSRRSPQAGVNCTVRMRQE